jgi:hypothetical protein
MTAPAATPAPVARSYGKRQLPDARHKVTHERWNAAEHAALMAAAAQAGLPAGAYIRSLVLGAPGPRTRRQPPANQAELARLLGELGRIGSNVNQLARIANTTGDMPPDAQLATIAGDVRAMRDALMTVLGRGD